MSSEFVAILGVGAGILGVGVSLAAVLLANQRSFRTEMIARLDRMDGRFDRMEQAIRGLSDRVARIEGALWGRSAPGLPLPAPQQSDRPAPTA